MKKMLMVSSVASMIYHFNQDNIKILQELNYEVHIATNFKKPGAMNSNQLNRYLKELNDNGVKCHQIDFTRNIRDIKSLSYSFKKLKMLSREYSFEFVHTHTPIASVISRLVFKNTESKIIYTAHGFQFFKGGPIKDWILYYPIEKFLSKTTDILITINETDYLLSQKNFKAKTNIKIPGVGIDTKHDFSNYNRIMIRNRINVPLDAILISSVGELSVRKNHMVIIKAISELIPEFNIHYVICGEGRNRTNLEKAINNLGLQNRVQLLGYRSDVSEIVYASDISAFPSKREGLGLAGLEAMTLGLPIITSNVQGIVDYSKDGITGYVCDPNSVECFKSSIKKIIADPVAMKKIGTDNIQRVYKYDKKIVNKIMEKIYKSI